MSLTELALVLGVACLTVLGAFALISRPRKTQFREPENQTGDDLSFLFSGDVLEHATPSARDLLDPETNGDDWAALHHSMVRRFPKFPMHMDQIEPHTTCVRSREATDSAYVELFRDGALIHVRLIESEVGDPVKRHQLLSFEAELGTLRMATSTAPYPIWQVSDANRVLWHNHAYADVYRNTRGVDPTPEKPLFDPAEIPRDGIDTRRSLRTVDGGKTLWLSVTAYKVDGGRMFHAVDIEAVIQAEIAQRNFVQTLAKTFAQLSTALAIFDRHGHLALFNPALMDLTALPAEFLSARPDLFSFFDRLRENRMMPEPKDYKSWRQQFTDLVAAAADGHYRETWALDGGRTYRVTGRPHPDGAIAFLIEDISAEILLTRNFRAEMELCQSLMDSFDEGLAVFSSSGILTFCNSAYRRIWRLDPENAFADVSILDSVRAWQEQCQPAPVMKDIRDYVMRLGDRAELNTEFLLRDGCALQVSVQPLTSGATVLRFSETETRADTKQTAPAPEGRVDPS